MRSDPPELRDVAVVGAGIAGLTLARALSSKGMRPLVLERSRGVGGRCATRRIEGQPVDHGVAFLHGRSADFLAEVAALGETNLIAGWPRAREGSGLPCSPRAFESAEERVALVDGVSAFAKHLARGLDIRLATNVSSLRLGESSAGGPGWELVLESGQAVRARVLVLTMPAPSIAALLSAMAPVPRAITELLPLLACIRMLPCMTVIARYPRSLSPPAWDASFPATSPAIQNILHDSTKRRPSTPTVLVIQARARFSRVHLDEPAEAWTSALLDEAAHLHGGWIAETDLVQSHLWHHARVEPTSPLAAPIAVKLEGGEVLGLAGDGFQSTGGIEGAYHSGAQLANRLATLLR